MTTPSDSMRQLGYASVIAVLQKDRKSKVDNLTGCFHPEPDSPLGGAALLMASGTGAGRRRRAATPQVRVYPHLGIVYGTVDRDGWESLRASEDVRKIVAAAVPSLIRPTVVRETTGGFHHGVTWGLASLGVPELWAQGLTGAGVTIAHLDTGVDGEHPALAGAVGHFAEFDLTGAPVGGSAAHDSDLREGHGTHTAASIAGRAVSGKRVGVAPGATLCSAIVIEGGDAVARILSGMDWAVEVGARALSLSLGIRGLVNNFLAVVETLRDNGVLPVVAVGNEGPGTSRSPGNYPKSLSVGACTEGGQVWDDSSSQRFRRRSQPLVPDIVAPGAEIVSAKPGGGWRTMSGSSMATPHVAGLAALLLEAKPTATVAQLERAIQKSAALGTMDPERVNRGVVNGPRALAALR